jgi:hypothetical protein
MYSMHPQNKKKLVVPLATYSPSPVPGPYPKVGEPIIGEHPAVFELVVDDHVAFVDPAAYDLKDCVGLDPNQYFVTSGDAVEKARALERDLWQLAGEVRKQSYQHIADERKVSLQEAQRLYRNGERPKKPKRYSEYETAVWQAAGSARSLLNALKKAKGTNIFLETDRDEDHRLLCVPKNPRAKQD